MQIHYHPKTDLLYITFDDRDEQVLNKQVAEDVMFNLGKEDKIVGIEIMNASKHVSLDQVLLNIS